MIEVCVRGVTLSIADWARILGRSPASLYSTLAQQEKKGVPREQAIELLLQGSRFSRTATEVAVGPISATLDEWAAAIGIRANALTMAARRHGHAGTRAEQVAAELSERLRGLRRAPRPPKQPKRYSRSGRKLARDEQIVARHKAGETLASIAADLGITKERARQVVRSVETLSDGHRWQHGKDGLVECLNCGVRLTSRVVIESIDGDESVVVRTARLYQSSGGDWSEELPECRPAVTPASASSV